MLLVPLPAILAGVFCMSFSYHLNAYTYLQLVDLQNSRERIIPDQTDHAYSFIL